MLLTLLERIPPAPRLLVAGLIQKNMSKEDQQILSQDITEFSEALKTDNAEVVLAILKKYRLHEYL